jgi:hypothetical protein
VAPLYLIYSTHSFVYSTLIGVVLFSLRIVSLPFEVLNQNESSKNMYSLLPLSKDQVITARYLSIVLVGCFSISLSVVTQIVVALILKIEIDIQSIFLALAIGFSCISILMSIQIPFIYKMGVIKSRSSAPAIIATVSLFVFHFGYRDSGISEFSLSFLIGMFLFVAACVFFVSKSISVHIVRKQGF